MKRLSCGNSGFISILSCSFVSLACSANSGSGSSTPTGVGGGSNSSATGGSAYNAGSGSPNTAGGAANALQKDGLHIVGKVRDFHKTFADMEPCTNNPSANPKKLCDSQHVEQNPTKSDGTQNCGAGTPYPNSCFIGTTLGSDSKPTYAGPANGTVTTTGPDNFKWWFNTDPSGQINQEMDLEFVLSPNGDGTYTYNNTAYFPIDGQLFLDEGQTDATGKSHNYGFTTEFHMKFTYRAGQTFYFKGDDDLVAFINNELVVDRSGIHNAQDATLKLDVLGLQAGQSYQFDLFYCERHVTASDLLITTSMEFTEAVQIN